MEELKDSDLEMISSGKDANISVYGRIVTAGIVTTFSEIGDFLFVRRK